MCRTVRIIRMRFLTRKIIMRKSMENLRCIQEINFKQDLKEIIMEKRPEIIFTTAEYDRHGDHSGLVFFY